MADMVEGVDLTAGANVTIAKTIVAGTRGDVASYAISASAGGGGGVTELSYVEFTSSVSVTASTEAGANDIVTAAAITASGSTRICIEFYAPYYQVGATATTEMYLVLKDGSTAIGWLARFTPGLTVTLGLGPILARRFLTPTAGSHTYKVSAYKFGGSTNAVNAGAGGAGAIVPGYIRITSGG